MKTKILSLIMCLLTCYSACAQTGHTELLLADAGNDFNPTTQSDIDKKTRFQIDPVAAFPFDRTAFISFFVPYLSGPTRLVTYDPNGNSVKEYDLEENGRGSISVFSHDLLPGQYISRLVNEGGIRCMMPLKVLSR